MANSKTEHSRKLRAKTSAEHSKRLRAEGLVKRIAVQVPTAVANDFDEIGKQLGLSRPQTLKALCEFYLTHKN